jgi:hypothetical protein
MTRSGMSNGTIIQSRNRGRPWREPKHCEPDKLEEAKAIAQADHDAGNDARP